MREGGGDVKRNRYMYTYAESGEGGRERRGKLRETDTYTYMQREEGREADTFREWWKEKGGREREKARRVLVIFGQVLLILLVITGSISTSYVIH